jgi:hypothetical protein
MKHEAAIGTRGLAEIEAIVLVHADAELARDVASPAVGPRDPVRVSGRDAAEKISADDISAVVRFAEARQSAVGHVDRLDGIEHSLPKICPRPRDATASAFVL